MIEFEYPAVFELIDFYEKYISGSNSDTLSNLAKKIGHLYGSASPLLHDTIWEAVGPLEDFYEKTGVPPITKERAKEILEGLKKLKIELEKK